MKERRRGTRLRSSHSATIAWGAISHVNCVIQNFSAKGARLELPLASKIPDRFDLIVDRDQAVLHCRVMWRDEKDQTIGVEFERRPGESPVAAAVGKAH
jgi:hypothetical protein